MIIIRKKILNSGTLYIFIFFTFIASIVYVSIKIALAPTVAPSSEITERVKGDYILMLLQSIFGAAAMLLPSFLIHRINLKIPSFMLIMYAVFLYCAIYLGEVRNFYYNVPHWDTILHTFSGAGLGALGFSIVTLLNKSENITFTLSPGFVALFAFCFAVSLGVIWEFYEFGMDCFLNTNMQKYALETGELLIGQESTKDTMKDLIVDSAGAFIISTIGYISLKYDKGWTERFKVKIEEEKAENESRRKNK